MSQYQSGQLASSSPLLGTELVAIDNGGAVNVRATTAQIAALSGTIVSNTAQFDKTSDTALADVPLLTLPVAAGGTYVVRATLPVTSGASGGVKVALGGTATLTSSNITAKIFNTAVSPVVLNTTSGLGTGQGATQVAVQVQIDAVVVVSAAGTLTVQFAQNASNGTASSVLIGGTFTATRIA